MAEHPNKSVNHFSGILNTCDDKDQLEAVRAAIEAGHIDVNENLPNRIDLFATVARDKDKEKFLPLFLKHVKDVNKRYIPVSSDRTGPGGVTAIIIATLNGNTAAVSQLLAAGADPAIKALNDKDAIGYAELRLEEEKDLTDTETINDIHACIRMIRGYLALKALGPELAEEVVNGVDN